MGRARKKKSRAKKGAEGILWFFFLCNKPIFAFTQKLLPSEREEEQQQEEPKKNTAERREEANWWAKKKKPKKQKKLSLVAGRGRGRRRVEGT